MLFFSLLTDGKHTVSVVQGIFFYESSIPRLCLGLERRSEYHTEEQRIPMRLDMSHSFCIEM